jgi:hypothetical protein
MDCLNKNVGESDNERPVKKVRKTKAAAESDDDDEQDDD